jgi:hypothetical protein
MSTKLGRWHLATHVFRDVRKGARDLFSPEKSAIPSSKKSYKTKDTRTNIWGWERNKVDLSINAIKPNHFFLLSTLPYGARGSVVGWGTMLQAGMSRVRVPMLRIFFNWPNPSCRTMDMRSTQPLTKMSTMNLPGGKGRPARKVDKLTAICEPIV